MKTILYIDDETIKEITVDELRKIGNVEKLIVIEKAKAKTNEKIKIFNSVMIRKIELLKEELLKTDDSTKVLYSSRLLGEMTSIFRLANNIFGE